MSSFMNIQETLQFIPACFKYNIVPLLLGHTGVGKTQVVKQYAEKKGLDCIVLHLSQLEPADFLGNPKIVAKLNYKRLTEKQAKELQEIISENIPLKLEAYLSDHPEVQKAINWRTEHAQPSWLPDAEDFNPKGGIVYLDEINRGHEDIRQAMYQLIDTKSIHTYKLPDNYKIVGAANPFESYEVYEFDAALKARFAWIKFKPTFEETQEYLEKKHGKYPIIDWVKTDKSLVEYGDDFKVDDQVYCPRFEEYSIQLFSELMEKPLKFIRKCLSTIMSSENVTSFLKFLEELKNVSIKEILNGKKLDRIKYLVKMKRMDVISTLVGHLADHFREFVKEKKLLSEKEVINASFFLINIPRENCMAFLDGLQGEYRGSENDKYYITKHAYFKKHVHDRLKDLKRLFQASQ